MPSRSPFAATRTNLRRPSANSPTICDTFNLHAGWKGFSDSSSPATAGTSAPTSGPGADFEQLSYDAAGNVASLRTRAGQTVGYSYDALNRLAAKDLPGSELTVSYSYDLLGRMLTAVTSAQTLIMIFYYGDSDSRAIYVFNARGEIIDR